MVSVDYSHRILCDAEFINWLSVQSGKEIILSHLMHIKSSSQYHKRDHNLILREEVKLCGGKIETKYFYGALKSNEEPDFLTPYKDRISKNIIFGINLTEEYPFKCYLFTSPEKEREYRNNKHYQGIRTLQILSGANAIKIIEDFFKAFNTAREIQR